MSRLQVCKLNLSAILSHLPLAFDFTVQGGSCMGISGPSGIGKSVLLKAIADMIPHRGNIFLDSVECMEYPAPQWRKKVALLPAESQWWFEQVGEHFTDFNEQLFSHFGFDKDVMNWQISHLSSGEKQRLALIRLLLNKPEVLLLDEPTANLDQLNLEKVEALITDYRLHDQLPVLWISHDQEQLNRVSQNILYFDTNSYNITPCTGGL
jgi:ABC-type iron transport system FetAB ATPase subunit